MIFYNLRLKAESHAGVPVVHHLQKLIGPGDYEFDYVALICYSIVACWTVKDQLG